MNRLWCSAALAALLGLAAGEAYTPKHEAGRCAIRGSCGSSGFWSPALPCPDNGLAEEPEDDVRKQLVEICGLKWNTGPICCDGDQVLLAENFSLYAVANPNSLTHYRATSRRRTISFLRARHAKRTFTTSSAPSHALPTSRCS
jgi:hypothetical protein